LGNFDTIQIAKIQRTGAITRAAPRTIDKLCIEYFGIFYIQKPDAGEIGILNFNAIDHDVAPVVNKDTAVKLFGISVNVNSDQPLVPFRGLYYSQIRRFVS